MFIYRITNTANGKVYIGKTVGAKIEKRLNHHKCLLASNKHINKHLQAAYNKYGKDAFFYEVLETHINKEDLDDAETVAIIEHRSANADFGYNKTFGGEGNLLTEETRKKIGNSHKGKIVSQETRQKLAAANRGKKASEATKKKQSLIRTGKKYPNHSIGMTGEGNPRYGIKLNDDTKQKISNARLGQTSPRKGVTLSPETKAKLSGPKSDQHRENLKKAWAQRKAKKNAI